MNNSLHRARHILHSGGYTCVFCRGEQTVTSRERGIAPLLDLLDEGRDVRGFAAADRIVGKAAAMLYLLLGVAEVYAEVISESALAVLRAQGIAVEYGDLCAAIRNRANTGICPMEEAVQNIVSPPAAVIALRQRRAELAAGK